METKPLIVCVDDDPMILALLRAQLAGEPYEIYTTTDPLLAIRVLESWDVGLLLADQRMPHMQGTELLQVAGEISPRTVRVLLTGHADGRCISNGLKENVQWLVSKPWDARALRDLLRDLLRARELRRNCLGLGRYVAEWREHLTG